VVLLMFGSLLTAGALLYGIVFGVKHFAPGWELPVLGVVFFALLGLVLPVLHVNALFLARSREKLVEVLGSSG
jgi:pilus assembly protein TadC